MARDPGKALMEWLEAQADFGLLARLPDDVTRSQLESAEKLLALRRRNLSLGGLRDGKAGASSKPGAADSADTTQRGRTTGPGKSETRQQQGVEPGDVTRSSRGSVEDGPASATGTDRPAERGASVARTAMLPLNAADQPAGSGTAGAWESLEELRAGVCDCSRCEIAARRTNFVFGRGDPQADLVIVGEAPGAQEDLQGEPFVGPAGQLLDRMLAAIGFGWNEVYICNILKCRPTNNRDPNPQEVASCEPYLHEQLALIRPKLILAVGRVAGKTLLRRESALKNMRGTRHDYWGVPMLVSYHPAALLRNPHWKRPAWEDLQETRRLYDRLGGRPGSLTPAFNQ